MFDPFFDKWPVLLQGAVIGLIFGFLLQKGGVTRYNVILGQFLLKDFTVLKVMLTAIVVGAVGVYAMLQAGLIDGLYVKPALLLANAAGGVIFGVGMTLLGYCPGTGVAALGDGSRHALPGVLGMIVGAALYAEVHPLLTNNVLKAADLGKATFVTMTNVSPWWIIAGLALLAILLFVWLERREHGSQGGAAPPRGALRA